MNFAFLAKTSIPLSIMLGRSVSCQVRRRESSVDALPKLRSQSSMRSLSNFNYALQDINFVAASQYSYDKQSRRLLVNQIVMNPKRRTQDVAAQRSRSNFCANFAQRWSTRPTAFVRVRGKPLPPFEQKPMLPSFRVYEDDYRKYDLDVEREMQDDPKWSYNVVRLGV